MAFGSEHRTHPNGVLDTFWADLLELGEEGPQQGGSRPLASRDVERPRPAVGLIRDLESAGRPRPGRQGLEQTCADQAAYVVQRAGRADTEALGELLVRHRLVQRQPQNTQSSRGAECPDLLLCGPRPVGCRATGCCHACIVTPMVALPDLGLD